MIEITGYLYQEGLVLSPDGHCRAFDAKGQGMLVGNGVGIVVVKILADALADGDTIHAIIKGSAINNDGNLKAGFTAPSVEGQASAVSEAQEIAEIDPETITYIEAHGTATPLGDPIEIKALTKVFRAKTQKKGFCGIGSVKTNIGHLDAAAGVAGLIKTILALKHQQIPPSLNFETPNPECDFENSPFYVNTQLKEWESQGSPRRAGVSSFGMGGTNAHVILEEWNPFPPLAGRKQQQQLLLLSAKTPTALETVTINLANHLKAHPELNLADVAYTLTVGRKAFEQRRIAVVSDLENAASALLDNKPVTNSGQVKTRSVVFMFSGQGSQYVNMARELYETQTPFREPIDKCCTLLQSHLGFDLREILYPTQEQTETATEKLKPTAITQPALFVIEYALAQLWMSWGIKPAAMIGHSIGEYVAATLAGVFSLEDALALVTTRGQLMQSMPTGSMLAIPLPENEVKALIAGTSLEIATINSPNNCVISGTTAAIEAFEKELASKEIEGRHLHTSHAYHSSMMEGMLAPFTDKVKLVKLNAPTIPFISNLTGTWITPEQATNPSYYAQHLRSCVRFADGIKQFFTYPDQILLEVGPGRTLSTLAKRHPDKPTEQITLTSVRHPQEEGSDVTFLLKALGQLWLAGTEVNWDSYYGEEKYYRIPLPTYPFERKRYWIDPPQKQPTTQVNQQQLWQSAVAAGFQQAQEGISQFEQPDYLEQQVVQDRICAAYMAKAIKDLGIFANPEDKYSLAEIFEQFPIKADYKQLLTRWLEVLVQRGMLQQKGEYFFQLQALSPEEFDALVQEFQAKFANQPEQARLIQGFGNNHVPLLKGEEIGQNILFADGNLDVYAKLEKESEGLSSYNNAIMRAIVEKVVQSLPQSNHLKILEIGAGQGLSTNWLLPLLPPERTHYTYTDIGESFLKFGKKKFQPYSFIEYRVFDMEKSPESQGFELNSYDLIVATDVIHVTNNIDATLERVRSLLASGGLFLLNELTLPNLQFDIIYGLLMPSFDDPSFDDGVRNSGNPFLTKEQWQQALQSHGFVEVKNFPEQDVNGHHIILGRASKETKNSVPVAFTRQVEVIRNAIEINEEKSERPELSQAYEAPQSHIEQTIAQIWQKDLGIEKIGVNDNFFELGGDSLIAAILMNKINSTFSTKLQVKILFECSSVAELAQVIENLSRSDNSSSSFSPSETLDLEAEAVLEPSIQFDLPLSENIDNPKAILLTGATGFIGPYLLEELLKKTSANIYCLMRGSSLESARERLVDKMKIYLLWNENYRTRVIPVLGDLSKPLLGIQEEQYTALAKEIDVIYHNGAWVNFIYPYAGLKGVNVLGTQEILRFAGHRQTKSVHFVSTIAVFSSAYKGKEVFENEMSKEPLPMAYGQSKWVAEHLIRLAQDRGLPTSIYRLAQVTPFSQTGIMDNKNDFFSSLMIGSIQAGIAPIIEGNWGLMPVDYVTQSLVYLSQQRRSFGKRFTIINPHVVSWKNVVNAICAYGYKLVEVEVQEWISKITEQISQGKENVLAPFLSSLETVLYCDLTSGAIKFNTDQTLEFLSGSNIVCPPFSNELIYSYLSYFVKKGRLKPPALIN